MNNKKPKRGRPIDIQKDVNILCMAGELFVEQGFHATSMEQIAKQAGVSKITLYSRYKDKDELFKEVISNKCKEKRASIEVESYANKPVKESLIEMGLGFIELITSDETIKMHRVIEAESVRYPKIAELFYEAGPVRFKAEIQQLFEAWQKQGKLKSADMAKAVEQFLSLIKGEIHMKMLLNIPCKLSKKQINEHVSSAVGVFVAAYGA